MYVLQEERSQGQQSDPNAAAACSSSYEENEQELLCVCQQPYNVDTAMISCDVCEDWYHLRCVGMTQTAAKSMKKYTCPVCVALKGNAEPLEAALAKVCFPSHANDMSTTLYGCNQVKHTCLRSVESVCPWGVCVVYHLWKQHVYHLDMRHAYQDCLHKEPGMCCRICDGGKYCTIAFRQLHACLQP